MNSSRLGPVASFSPKVVGWLGVVEVEARRDDGTLSLEKVRDNDRDAIGVKRGSPSRVCKVVFISYPDQ